jgi:hypothetical protein
MFLLLRCYITIIMRSSKDIYIYIYTPHFSVDNAHPKLFRHSFWLHLIYLTYLSNVYCACSFPTNLEKNTVFILCVLNFDLWNVVLCYICETVDYTLRFSIL